LISGLFILGLLSDQCGTRKIFFNIQISGQLVSFLSGTPSANEAVALMTVNGSGSSYEDELDGTTTDAQGKFVLRSKQSRANTYFLCSVVLAGLLGRTPHSGQENPSWILERSRKELRG